MSGRPLTRRTLLTMGGGALLGAASVAGCEFLSTDPNGDRGGGRAAKGKESPGLAELVKQGELPPVEDRLPGEPLVIEPAQTGSYGGAWHTATLQGDYLLVYGAIGYDSLVRWDPEWTQVLPNLAESYDVEGDGLVYTFRLRRGVKWSDGKPFTADDLLFAYEDVLGNKEIYPVFPEIYTVNDQPGTLEKVDDHTVRFTFAAPHGLFLQRMAGLDGHSLTLWPRHHLQRYHERYSPDVASLAEEEGYSDWVELFTAHAPLSVIDVAYVQNAELPTLCAWTVTEPIGAGNRVVFERNPYYWKVDPDGSQLPYLDRVVLNVVGDAEVLLLNTSEGEFSLPMQDVLTQANKPVLAQSREQGGYHFVDLETSHMNVMTVDPNHNHRDPRLRAAFQDKEFRIGLSHAINREEIIDTVFQQQGEPWQAAPRRKTAFFNETLAKQYTEYDVAKANQYLDRAGYAERDREGFRLAPDGVRISFRVMAEDTEPTWVESLNLIAGYWREVGIDMRPEILGRALVSPRLEANEYDAVALTGSFGLRDCLLNPEDFLPSGWGYARQWALWYQSGGEEGERPPAGPRRQMELYDQLKTTFDQQVQVELFEEVLRISQEEFYQIGIALPTGEYTVLQDNFRNVPAPLIFADLYYPTPGPTRPEQYFITDE